jgi:RHS repeat-associated protein
VVGNLLTGLNIDEYYKTGANGGVTFMTDALGSTIGLVNSSGSIVGSYTYAPFGKTTASGSANQPFQFTGRENDADGLYYYRARYYNPLFQRFIAQDPIEFAGGINLYGYVDNAPTEKSDPSGLCGPDPVIPCFPYAFCGRFDLYRICRKFTPTPTNDCVRMCLLGNFNCQQEGYNDPIWARFGPFAHASCFRKCGGIPIPRGLLPEAWPQYLPYFPPAMGSGRPQAIGKGSGSPNLPF